MLFKFGKASAQRLDELHFDLQLVAREALAMGLMDFTITEGHRGEELQTKYFNEGKSRVQYPDGKHNKLPAEAFDGVPWIKDHISYNKAHCCVLAGIILTCAKKLGVGLRWGGNWDMDEEPVTDQDFQDLVHFELMGG